MSSRRQSSERTLKILRNREQQIRAELVEIDLKSDEMQAAYAEISASLSGDSILAGLFVDILAKRMRDIDSQMSALTAQRDAVCQRALDAAARTSKAKTIVATLTAADQQNADKKNLQDLIELLSAFPAARSE